MIGLHFLSVYSLYEGAVLVKVNFAGSLFPGLTAIGVARKESKVDIEVRAAARTGSPHSASIAV
jgi:hypothetical protein